MPSFRLKVVLFVIFVVFFFSGKSEHIVTPVVYSTANNVEHKCVSFAENHQPSKQVLNTPLSMILSGEQREKSAHFSLAACHGSQFNLSFSPHVS